MKRVEQAYMQKRNGGLFQSEAYQAPTINLEGHSTQEVAAAKQN